MLNHESVPKQPFLTQSFKDRDTAERAFDTMLTHGYKPDEIHVIMMDDTRKRLTSLSWLMKTLTQPLSRLVNPHGTAGMDGGRNNGFGVWKAFEGAGHDRRRSSWSAPRILVN